MPTCRGDTGFVVQNFLESTGLNRLSSTETSEDQGLCTHYLRPVRGYRPLEGASRRASVSGSSDFRGE